jgi:hypothetical protein
MKALPSSATFGLLAVPSTTIPPACDRHETVQPWTTLGDEFCERHDSAGGPSKRAARRMVSLPRLACVLATAGLLLAGAVATACANHGRSATTIAHLGNQETQAPFAMTRH